MAVAPEAALDSHSPVSCDVWNCYKYYAQVRKLVEQWFAEKVTTMGHLLRSAITILVIKRLSVPYYQNFLKVVES